MDLFELLGSMVVHQASDLFISVDSPPLMKIEGKLKPVKDQILTTQENHDLIYSILDEKSIAEFKATRELNTSLKLDRIGQFRINVFQQCGEPAMVIRYVKKHIPSIEDLGLPLMLKDIIMKERGLVLLVGATGTGKSTTLAAMIDYRNSNKTGHILTIEDPIEFVHKNKMSLVNQREVGVDTDSYEIALKNAMREAPDVILIGEIRDRETMKQALSYAETGHLCLATLHASNSSQALERIVNFFPEEAHQIILQDLSTNLEAIVAQRLCHGIEQKRVAAVEIMNNTPFIKKLISKDRLAEIRDAMVSEKSQVNRTFDEALYELVTKNRITREEALQKADSANNLRVKFRLEDGTALDDSKLEKKDSDAFQEIYTTIRDCSNKKAEQDVRPFYLNFGIGMTSLVASYAGIKSHL